MIKSFKVIFTNLYLLLKVKNINLTKQNTFSQEISEEFLEFSDCQCSCHVLEKALNRYVVLLNKGKIKSKFLLYDLLFLNLMMQNWQFSEIEKYLINNIFYANSFNLKTVNIKQNNMWCKLKYINKIVCKIKLLVEKCFSTQKVS